jgi:hypothetical protein
MRWPKTASHSVMSAFPIERLKVAFLTGCGVFVFLATAAVSNAAITNVTATALDIIVSGEAPAVGSTLFEVSPWERTVLPGERRPLARLQSGRSFRILVPRMDGARDRLYSGFNLERDSDPSTRGAPRFVERFEGVSPWNEPFPAVASKKGLQVQMVDDAIALGVKHAALNVSFNSLVTTGSGPETLPWNVDGTTVHLSKSAVERMDSQVKPLSDAGMVVSLILLYYESGNAALDRIMLHPGYDRSAPNRLSTFNTTTPEGFLYYRAAVEFLAARYSRPDRKNGRAVNFIVGNEVNSHWYWANMGRVSMEIFAADYERTVRATWTAVRRFAPTSRIYVSLEHHWNIRYPAGSPEQSFAARPFLEEFERLSRAGGDFGWNVAFHPYPENLFEPRFWNDKSATDSPDTSRITFKNMPQLSAFLGRPEMRYDGKPRRVILSEQGFHTPDGPDGEAVQAAAYAYAYRLVEKEPGIDSFILHRHVDHGQEGGLRLGLWSRDPKGLHAAVPLAKKKIYEVFKAADTPDWVEAFRFALPIIGLERWP